MITKDLVLHAVVNPFGIMEACFKLAAEAG
jgi:hypothetical protein